MIPGGRILTKIGVPDLDLFQQCLVGNRVDQRLQIGHAGVKRPQFGLGNAQHLHVTGRANAFVRRHIVIEAVQDRAELVFF
ncbi:hypothetical protein D3C86_2098720 [compost metagenome]